MKKQQGSAVFLLMLAFFMAFVSVAVSKLSVNQLRLKQQQKNLKILTLAKQALADYKNINSDLPCPDTDGDGLLNGTSCVGITNNLPWKDLQLNEIKNSYGDSIQYIRFSATNATVSMVVYKNKKNEPQTISLSLP